MVRVLLQETCPEIVGAAEAFSRHVLYVPVTALGHAPDKGEDGAFAVRPRDIRAQWVAVPFLYVLAQLGLLAVVEDIAAAGVPPTEGDVAGDQIRVRVPGTEVEYFLPLAFADRNLVCPATRVRFHVPRVDSGAAAATY
ncbi:MAG: hypothetical protein HY720_09610 [Planctomycetes bacterium]|nr:hypothetical protein [Planctomycetota bacterium]